MSASANSWHPATRIAFRFAVIYFGGYLLTTQMFWGAIAPWADVLPIAMLPPCRTAILWIAGHLFGLTTPLVIEGSGSGDKIFDWLHVFLLLSLALPATASWTILDRKRTNYLVLHDWFRLIVRVGLGTTMLGYGAAKAVPLQMGYGPSLSRLVEPFGNFSPMGVLWSSMGASPAYQSFTGWMEIAGGLLLLIPQTALLGTVVSLGVAIQIFVLNMTYDVPVKLFSFHLILLALFLLLPDGRRLWTFFFRHRAVEPLAPLSGRSPRTQRILIVVQSCFAIYVMATMAYGTRQSWYEFGGGAPKSPLYGIWNVERMSIDDEVRPPLLTDDKRWRRVIFDRPDRVGFQQMNDTLLSFNAKIEVEGKTIELTRTDNANWKAALFFDRIAHDRLDLRGNMEGRRVAMELRLLDRETFLLVNRGFHWVQERPFNR